MAFQFYEADGSPTQVGLNPPIYERVYHATGEESSLIVMNAARVLAPLTIITAVGTLYRQDVRLVHVGWGLYDVILPYTPRKSGPIELGKYTFSYDSTGGTVRIMAAKEHINSYPVGGGLDPDPHKGAIGVHDNQIEGADIIIPALKLTYGFRHANGIINEAFARDIARATGKTNLVQWQGFAPNELLFFGGTGSDGSETEAEATYTMVASENATGLRIGDIIDIAKKGHEYLWVEFTPSVTTNNSAAMKPRRVHIERMYDPIDFAATFGFGGP